MTTNGRDSHAPIRSQQPDLGPSVEHLFSRLQVLHLTLKYREGSQGVLNLVSFRMMVAVVFQISQPSSNSLTGRGNPFWHFLTIHF
jgi:hypothetical protein